MSQVRFSELRCVVACCVKSAALYALLLLLNACQTPPGHVAPSVQPSATLSPALPIAQAVRYAMRSDLSDVRFLVYRAGPLATLGHNHVIQARTITGDIYLATDFRQSSFSLSIPVADLQVDEPQARSVEGEEFAKQPDAEAIAGTSKNMLGINVLDAAHYPQIDIQSVSLVGPAWAPDVTLRIKLRGVERDMTIPVVIDHRDDQIVATAVFEIHQTDFGITPLSILGGAIQVADIVKGRLRIVARKG